MTHNRIRTALMDATISVVARDGIEKLTTRSIASECELHDTYIYRYFIDKDDLLKRTFLREDKLLNNIMLERINNTDLEGLHFRDKLELIWMDAWNLFMDNPDKCKFYVRYYYSEYFQDTVDEYRAENKALMNLFRSFFDIDTDVSMLYHYNIDTLLHMAMRVAIGELDNTEQLKSEIFELVYSINLVFTKKLEKLMRDVG
ncbi:MAG: TetR/AcrR family transcriptional regulator [Firmicutes bacterium]|nr:TetR/AcrR family transcriptional regulator [Bacillota bacterium]